MASVGEHRQIVLEKWTTPKSASGSLTDILEDRYPIWAEVRKRSGGRTYEDAQTKLSNNMEMLINWRSQFDLTATWKVVYDGRRHTVLDIEKVRERKFNYRLLVDSKGER